jgi:hypothetical protein
MSIASEREAKLLIYERELVAKIEQEKLDRKTERQTQARIKDRPLFSHYDAHTLPILQHMAAQHMELPCPLIAGVHDRPPKGRYIYLEHGAGATYGQGHESYSGGRGHDRCVMFLCPSQQVANNWRNTYPHTPAIVIGVPMLDYLHRWYQQQGPTTRRTVLIGQHWACEVAPDARTAMPQYKAVIGACVALWRAQGWTVFATAHPRIKADVKAMWDEHEVEMVDALGGLVRAGLVIADHTSLLPEAASCGRRVVFMRGRHYSKSLWAETGWPTVSSADELLALDLDGVPATSYHPYAFNDGRASARAADAIARLALVL